MAADVLPTKRCEGGRVINAVVLVATGVNGDGHREFPGMHVATFEMGAAWCRLVADQVGRGRGGVRLVRSDVHAGVVEVFAAHNPLGPWRNAPTSTAATGNGPAAPRLRHR
ncbi:transposase [Brachybacterium vulturis]|uniref:transposase n=1 Tax=Brachybacterium vulturis TaxID=2017484 RepID=UPI002678D41A